MSKNEVKSKVKEPSVHYKTESKLEGNDFWINERTGERRELNTISKKVYNLKQGWRRVYMESFMELLAGLYSAGRKIDIIEFILDNLNSENQFTLRQIDIAEKLGVANKTIIETYKYLESMRFWRKVGTAYIVNPNFVCALGSDRKNKGILIKFESAEPNLPGFE